MNIDQFIAAAQGLKAENIDVLTGFYAPDCVFEDPFQTVNGRAAVAKVYQTMFDCLHDPRFVDVCCLGQRDGPLVIVGWRFEFSFKPGAPRQAIPGISLLKTNADGLIGRHTDYWDGSRLMQALPVVGGLVGWLRARIAHS